jgi:hypothetical protein
MANPLWKQIWIEILAWWKKVWFEAKLTARLKMIEWENQWESEAERKERFEPVYQEKRINEEQPTGESRLLVGDMRLAAKWVIEAEEKVETDDAQGKI